MQRSRCLRLAQLSTQICRQKAHERTSLKPHGGLQSHTRRSDPRERLAEAAVQFRSLMGVGQSNRIRIRASKVDAKLTTRSSRREGLVGTGSPVVRVGLYIR